MTDQKSGKADPLIRQAFAEIGEPPAPDRDALWDRVAAEVATHASPQRGPISVRRLSVWGIPTAAIAAGITLWLRNQGGFLQPPMVSPSIGTSAASVVEMHKAVTSVAGEHLATSETLLLRLVREARTPVSPIKASELARSAGGLLAGGRVIGGVTEIRPETQLLLHDVELALTQLAAAGSDTEEIVFATLTVDKRDLLHRLRIAADARQ